MHLFFEQLLEAGVQILFAGTTIVLPDQIMVFSGSLTHVSPRVSVTVETRC